MSTALPKGETAPPGKRDFERLSHFRYRLRRFLRFSELLCARHGITSLQYQLLLHTMGFPGRDWASVGELAERLQARHHGVVALVDRCEKVGLLERHTGRSDQRVVEIHLLPKGRRLLATLAAAHRNELRELMRTFGDEVPTGASPRRSRPARPASPGRA